LRPSGEHAAADAILARVTKRTGPKLLAFDRRLGGRLVAGADEAGRGPLAGPLVVAGVLLDIECVRDHRARPLGLLNDSKQVDAATREELYRAVLACAERVSVHVFPPAVIDRDGLHKSNLRGLREALWACQPADVSVVDGFKLGPSAPPHRAVVDGDTKSAAIAAASIVAKVTRDRYMRTGCAATGSSPRTSGWRAASWTWSPGAAGRSSSAR